MKVLIIEENDLRKEHRLFIALLPLSALMHFKKRNRNHLCEFIRAQSQCDRHKRIITARRTDGIQFVLDPLPALVAVTADLILRILKRFLFRTLPGSICVLHKFFLIFFKALLSIRSQDLIHLRHRESAVLLSSRTQDNVSHNVERRVQRLRLIVPDISHLKTALQHGTHVKQTAVHRIETRRLVMNIDITVLACLKFISCHKELAVKFFVQFIKNQAALRCHERAVRIRIALIPDIADRLALGVYIIHHMDEIKLIVAVVAIALRHRRIHRLKRAFDNIVHLLDRDAFFFQRLRLFFCKIAEKLQLLLCKRIQDAGSRLIYRYDYFLDIERFLCPVFLNHIHFSLLLFY